MALIEGIVVDGSGNPVLDSQGNFRLVRLAADDKGRLVLAGTISATISGADGAVVDGANDAIRQSVLDLTNANPSAVAIVDATGNQITSFGGGTQYTEDAGAAADPIGTALILVRKDTPAASVSADGDNIAQRGSNYGAAYTHLLDSSGAIISTFGGGTQYTEDAAAAADPVGNALMLVRRDSLSASEVSADGDNVAAKGSSKGEQYVKASDTDAVLGATSDAAVSTDTTGTISAKLRGVVKWAFERMPAALGQGTMAQSLRVVLASDQSVLSAAGVTRIASGSMTRPADTSVYAVGDGVTTSTSSPAAMTVSGVARVNGGSGVILGGKAMKSTTTTTNAVFQAWIFATDTGVTIPNDNAAIALAVVAQRATYVGMVTIDFTGGVVVSDGVNVPIVLSRQNMAFKCASGSADLLVIWEARAAYTPASAEVFYLMLDVLPD